ncbi:hypothetical protein [Thalassolituus sp.]|uniref:hypothetical protein n=1 Tax=Thalassolituus sp. TaxID=2030822 RepID=UPI002634B1EE|nr:hypothetical protein [Thalassolituus sp.]
MANPWARFGALVSPGAKAVVTVAAVNADGTSVVTLRSGGTLQVRGDSVAVGQKAIIQRGEIKGKAPDLPAVTIEV